MKPGSLSVGELLLAKGIISADQLRIVQMERVKLNQPIGQLLVRLGFVSEATLRDALGESLGHQSVDLSHAIIDVSSLRLVPRDLAKRHQMLPLSYDETTRRLTIAIADPNNLVALDQVRALFSHAVKIEPLLAGEAEIARAIDQYYGHELSIDGILHEIETGEIDQRSYGAVIDEYSHPVVRLVDALLTDAVKREASDIHFEPEANFLRIRYRIDGILRQIRALHKSYWAAMAVRLKVQAGLNIAETRAPQDGRMSFRICGRSIDFRVATQPTIHGETIVLRILDRQRSIVPLVELGLDDRQLGLLELMIARPEGIVLMTGPTGSGKTTTLYSVLNHLNHEAVNIMTLEDPVEYPMPMIRQTSVGDTIKLNFASGIRAMMRQDPDIILVGEIRDSETAAMAFHASMTGHRVFSTLHTNSAIGAIPRLLDLGVLPEIMTGNISGIIAQRLVRRLCAHCREPYVAGSDEHIALAGDRHSAAPTYYRSTGCCHCDFQGYRGRLAIMELLRIDGDLEELISRRATIGEIRKAALAKGFHPLTENGRSRVLDGSTSIAEVARVIDLTSQA